MRLALSQRIARTRHGWHLEMRLRGSGHPDNSIRWLCFFKAEPLAMGVLDLAQQLQHTNPLFVSLQVLRQKQLSPASHG